MVQPDEGEPRRILLVCPRCHGWSILVGSMAEDGRTVWERQAGHFGRPGPLAAVV